MSIQQFQGFAESMFAEGKNRNEVLVHLLKLKREAKAQVSESAIFDMVKLLSERRSAPNVNQEYQETQEHQESQESQGKPRNFNESLRKTSGAPRPPTKEEIFKQELTRGLPSTLPLGEYLALAVDEHGQRECTPLNVPWESPLFYFVRMVKAHPEMAKKTAEQALRAVETVMVRWRPKAPKGSKRCCDWHAWLDISQDDAHAEFIDTWDKIRYLPGHSPLTNAVEMARRNPLKLLEKNQRTGGYERFVSIAGWLQVGMGDKNIMLPVEDLAELLQVQPMTISRFRKWAKEDGFLVEVKPAEFRGKRGGGKATEFRFDVSRVPILMERQQDGTLESFRDAAAGSEN